MDYYINEKAQGNKKKQKALSFFILFILISSAIIIFLIWKKNAKVQSHYEQGVTFIQAEKYQEAMSLYRTIQEKTIVEKNQTEEISQYEKLKLDLEKYVFAKVQRLEQEVLAGQKISSKDVLFLNEMSELTVPELLSFIQKQGEACLLGELEVAAWDNVIKECLKISDVDKVFRYLESEAQAFSKYISEVQVAVRYMSQKNEQRAYTCWQRIIEQAEDSLFVKDYALKKQKQCRDDIFPVLYKEAESYLQQERWQTAASAFEYLLGMSESQGEVAKALKKAKQQIPKDWVVWEEPVEHIAIKPLIVRSDLAFDVNNPYGEATRKQMLLCEEFHALLEQLYLNQYVLVNEALLLNNDGKVNYLKVPPGKKPLVLVFEGMNYYYSRQKSGNNFNLKLNDQNKICGFYQNEAGAMVLDEGAEAIGILEMFLEQHPDFSSEGARATISLTGFMGIFGYIYHPEQLEEYNEQLAAHQEAPLTMSAAEFEEAAIEAEVVVQRLKAKGYGFASETYYNQPMRGLGLTAVQADTEKWIEQVEPLVGQTRIISFPQGSFIDNSTKEAKYLAKQEFKMFTGLGVKAYSYAGVNSLYYDKLLIGGEALENPLDHQLERFFDVTLVLKR